jgi:hypothetical protein
VIHWLWLLPAFAGGLWVGFFTAALLVAARNNE